MAHTSNSPNGSNRGGRPTREVAASKVRELTEKQRAFVIWMATPEGLRQPDTKREFALRIGVSDVMLWKYGKDPKIAEAIRFLVLQNAGNPDRIGQILDMVFDQALAKKDVRMAEVWMKATGVMSSFGRNADLLEAADELGESFSNYSDAELERLRELAAASELEQEQIRRAHAALNTND